MNRSGAALGGILFAVLIFGGVMIIRIVSRLFYSIVFLFETIGVLLFALVAGFVIYRILLGDSDDPRRT